MEPDRIRKMAVEELDEALVRFWARVGNLPDVNEHFAAALASLASRLKRARASLSSKPRD